MKTESRLRGFLRGVWWEAPRWLVGAAFSAAVVVILALPILAIGQVALSAGDVAPHDIYSPRHVSYVSTILTQAEQDKAAASVAPVYTSPDSGIARQQITARAR